MKCELSFNFMSKDFTLYLKINILESLNYSVLCI